MTETKTTIEEHANAYYLSRFDDEMQALLATYEDNEEAREQLEEMPLAVSLQSINVGAQECTWSILLGTGGPADRVLVTTDYSGDVESAEYQFQDWFQPWTEASEQDAELVEKFARVFYFDDITDPDTLQRVVIA